MSWRGRSGFGWFCRFPRADSPLEITPVGKRQVLDAKVVGIHKETDLALLKIDGQHLPTLPLGTRRPVEPGELVFAIGSPEGLQNSVTMGVVGLNTFILSQGGGSEGLGFA